MNEAEIDNAVEVIKERAPQFYKYAKYLADWRDVVNQSSDGWHSWRAGSKCADTLSALLTAVMSVARGRSKDMPTDAEFKKALTPIRATATKHNLTAPVLADDTPKPKAKAKVIEALDSEAFVTIAQRHGEDSEPDHEVGDLQIFFRAAYDLLTPEQRHSFLALELVRETVESALPIDPLPQGPAAADALRDALESGSKPGPGR
ncbi:MULTISPECIES: hypothetical protein [unclassified Bradyrhizobium]